MAKIGRPTKAVVVTDDERRALLRLTTRARVNRSLAFRARLVLACADGMADSAVARRDRTKNATVDKWRHRFIARRLDGLYDEPRVGAPRKISDEDVEAVLVKTLETPPPGETHWSTRGMAAKAGMSHTTVGRIWRTFGLKPHVTESSKLSPDPQLIEKIRDVVGLYMNPPTNAVVHVVLDNLSAHRAPVVLRYPRFHLHFTPTYASWLNLVERFFGLLTEKALRRGSHTSVPQLRQAILAYVDAHNEKGKPFMWAKTADEILDKMRRFGLRTQQVHGA
jgi:transposase